MPRGLPARPGLWPVLGETLRAVGFRALFFGEADCLFLSALVLDFLEYWNLIEQPMAFLKTKALWPLSLFLPNIGMDRAGLAFATSVVVLIPAVCIFLAGQEYLEQGIVATASKE